MFLPRKTALLAVALALCALPAARAADDEKYLPDETEAVVSINVRQFLDSALIKKANLDKALAGSDEAQKVLKELGLDPLKDIDRVLIASGGKAEDKSLFILQGHFDPAKFQAKAEEVAKAHKDHVKIHKGDGATIYEVSQLDQLIKVPPQAQDQVNLKDKSVFLAVADKNTVVAGSTKGAVGDALAKASGKKKTALKNKDLGALVAKIDPKQTIAVAVPGSMTGNDKIKSITGGITVAADIKIEGKVAAADLDAAKEIDDQIKEGLMAGQAIVGAFAAQQKALMPVVDILNDIKHESKDKDVTVKTTIKPETLEQLFKGLAALGAGGKF